MSDDFTKQLQENAITQEHLFCQQEEERDAYLKAKEKHRIDLYNEITVLSHLFFLFE